MSKSAKWQKGTDTLLVNAPIRVHQAVYESSNSGLYPKFFQERFARRNRRGPALGIRPGFRINESRAPLACLSDPPIRVLEVRPARSALKARDPAR